MLVHLCLSALLTFISPIVILHCYLWANKMMMMMMTAYAYTTNMQVLSMAWESDPDVHPDGKTQKVEWSSSRF